MAKKPNTVKAEDLSIMRMTMGGEKKYTKVIHKGVLKEWVGIGWLTLKGKPTREDYKRYPRVVD